MAKTAQQEGKDFEEDVRLAMKECSLKHPLAFHRLYDTRSAGAYLPEQPADFFVGYQGRLFLLECKSSRKHATLRAGLSSLVSAGQAALNYMWLRAGHHSLIMFKDQVSGAVEYWDGRLVYDTRRAERATLPQEGFFYRGHVDELKEDMIKVLRTLGGAT